jgi:hypothetical protein
VAAKKRASAAAPKPMSDKAHFHQLEVDRLHAISQMRQKHHRRPAL